MYRRRALLKAATLLAGAAASPTVFARGVHAQDRQLRFGPAYDKWFDP